MFQGRAQLSFFFKICNSVFRKQSILEEFEMDVLHAIDCSTVDIEGIPGLNLECIKIQQSDKYKTVDDVQQLQFSNRYLVRLLRQYLIKNTKVIVAKNSIITLQ